MVCLSFRFKGVAKKCYFCLHHHPMGLDPIGLRVCPGQAGCLGDLVNPHRQVSKLIEETIGFIYSRR
ncbi:MAG: hypothetical protein HQK58_06970 [Deltaproteobacteria bacterium]|nr:hypothetical protein [Deltaproteobacteria bacterium]